MSGRILNHWSRNHKSCLIMQHCQSPTKRSMSDQTLRLKNFRLPSWNDYYTGSHWSKRNKVAQDIHSLVVAEIKAQNIKPCERLFLKFAIKVSDSRRRDVDNFAVKFVVDSLVIAGILPDDDINHLFGYSVLGKNNVGLDEVTVTLSEP